MEFYFIATADFGNIDQVIDRLFLFPELVVTVFKPTNVFLKREKVNFAIGILNNKLHQPADPAEIEQQSDFDSICK